MKFTLYSNVHEFYDAVHDILMRHEAQNKLLLGNLIMGNKGQDKASWRNPKKWLMATVRDEKNILLTALMTPPYNLTLYATDNDINDEGIKCLVEGLKNYNIPGVITEKILAEKFAKEYAKQKNVGYETLMNQRTFQLTEVNSEIKRIGTLRLLNEKDLSFFPFWLEAFHASETYGKKEMPMPENNQLYNYYIGQKSIYILEVGGLPVSMAALVRELDSAIGVSMVYTPPYLQNKGYASSCVAQISELALTRGFKKCVLNTDLLNPTSNSIYQKVGYEPVCDVLLLNFKKS